MFVKRSSVLEAIEQYGTTKGSVLGTHSGAVDCAMMAIERLPAASAREVTYGEWVWDHGDVYTCTHCGEKNHVKEVMEEPVWPWCPNCGASLDWSGRNA